MGISVVDSYRGAHLFDILGLHSSVVDACFSGHAGAALGHWICGGGAAACDRRGSLPARMLSAAARRSCRTTAGFGSARRMSAEPHAWQPPTVKALAIGGGECAQCAAAYRSCRGICHLYARMSLRASLRCCAICWRFVRPGAELALERGGDAGEYRASVLSRSAMSLGSLEPGGAPDDYRCHEYAGRPVEHR